MTSSTIDAMDDSLQFENAMFGGIDAVLKHYQGYIAALAAKHEDRSRATLNAKDLEQQARIALNRCWEKQMGRGDIKNFDMLAKWAMQNEMSTQQGKEFCHKRGRCYLSFFSELEKPTHSEEENDVEAVLFHSTETSHTSNASGLDLLIKQIESHLDEPRLKTTFNRIIVDHPFEYLNPDNHTPRITASLACQLKTTPDRLLQDLDDIQFILMGYRENFQGASL